MPARKIGEHSRDLRDGPQNPGFLYIKRRKKYRNQ